MGGGEGVLCTAQLADAQSGGRYLELLDAPLVPQSLNPGFLVVPWLRQGIGQKFRNFAAAARAVHLMKSHVSNLKSRKKECNCNGNYTYAK